MLVERGASARRRVAHARLQPTLGNGIEPGGLARDKGLVEAEHTAVLAVALGAVDREGGAKASAIGRVCRGRNDVLAHGNGGCGNGGQSGSQARSGLREHQGTRLSAARQNNWATESQKAASGGRLAAAVQALGLRRLPIGGVTTARIINQINLERGFYYFWLCWLRSWCGLSAYGSDSGDRRSWRVQVECLPRGEHIHLLSQPVHGHRAGSPVVQAPEGLAHVPKVPQLNKQR